MGTINDTNSKDLAEAENIKKRWQEYTELYKKILMTGIATMMWLFNQSQTSWALGSITTNKVTGGDGIPPELLQILKDDAFKVLHSIGQQIQKTQ